MPGPDGRYPRESFLREPARSSVSRPDPDPRLGIRRQAEAIIETVLESGPMDDRMHLAEFVEQFPGQPEVALANFLREVRPRIADYTDPAL